MWNLTQVVKLSDGIFFANEFCEIWIEFFFFFWEVPRDEIKEKNWMKNKKIWVEKKVIMIEKVHRD